MYVEAIIIISLAVERKGKSICYLRRWSGAWCWWWEGWGRRDKKRKPWRVIFPSLRFSLSFFCQHHVAKYILIAVIEFILAHETAITVHGKVSNHDDPDNCSVNHSDTFTALSAERVEIPAHQRTWFKQRFSLLAEILCRQTSTPPRPAAVPLIRQRRGKVNVRECFPNAENKNKSEARWDVITHLINLLKSINVTFHDASTVPVSPPHTRRPWFGEICAHLRTYLRRERHLGRAGSDNREPNVFIILE